MIEFNDLRKQVEATLIIILLLLALFYGIFRAYPLLTGPNIKILNLTDGATVASTTFQVSGIVKRAKEITLQGKPITINDKGNFTETLVATYPYTILVLVATDKYGAVETKTLRVIPRD
ncbi:MAG: hypothetical protein NTW35_02565 [Candidatus Nomurabacteria bacterium]|nr:hypothetical protein [Candidatus Nomurabacteria bacterium]